ncbi:MAG: helix-turn-helix transcriptional regulator [Bryobacteraceae bacterium]|nr:helix-turn-helix transcriptional regulator [Bryobacteraceae bacterium]
MDEPGQKLKRVRERLNLRYRDVEEASQKISARHNNDEFTIALSRLADIENKGTVPTIFRLYSLCAIYRLDLYEVLEWYQVDMNQMATDMSVVQVERTHLMGAHTGDYGEVQLPLSIDPGVDLRKTTFLSRWIQRWGKLPVMLLNGLDIKNQRYGFIGTEDWSMYPLLQPGSFVVIDDTRRKIVNDGWTSEFDRPIYFLEHREGYLCCWCYQENDHLILQPHPSAPEAPQVWKLREIDVIGQVTGIATRLDQGRRRRTRS